MIGWRAKAGYAKVYPPSTMDDLIITDDNTVFTIPCGNYPTEQSGNGYPQIDYIVNNLEAIFGDDYYTLYGVPWTRYGSPQNLTFYKSETETLLESYVPSITLAYPNLWKKYYNDLENNVNTIIHYFVYIPSLDAVIFYNNQSPVSNCTVFRDNGGTLSILTGASGPSIFSTSGANANYYVDNPSQKNRDIAILGVALRAPYTPETNLRATSNYFRYRVGVNTNAVYAVRWSITADSVDYNGGFSSSFFNALFNDDTVPDFIDSLPPPPDPMEPIGPSGPGGGNGNFDPTSDIIGDSSLPTISAADTGFTRIYSPTLAQVQDLAQYLWTDETVVETIWNKIKQLLENPMDAIISFSLVPVPVQISGTKNFALAYIDTGVSMNTVANQFVDVDCGTFELKEYYGSALDYSPNTKVSCFLPFIGVVTLNTDEVMNTTLTIRYRVDIVSGSCVAKIFVNESCLYQFSGHCSIPIPISAADFSSYLSAAIGVAKLAIGAAAGGGAGVGAAIASEADVQQTTSGGIIMTSGIPQGPDSGPIGAPMPGGAALEASQTEPTGAAFDGIAARNITNVVGAVMGSKLHVEHSGSFSGNTGYLGIRRPYLIIQRPRMCMPNEYRSFNGYPSMITLNIGDCKGYTKVQQVQLKNIPATNPEQSEIMQLLKGGIII